MAAAPTTILIADDHPVMMSGLRHLLDVEPGFRIIAECSDGEAALHQIRSLQPAIALLDMSMPGLTGLDVLAAVATEGIATRVVFLTAMLEDEQVVGAVREGAYGIVLKDAATDGLLNCLRLVAAGERCLPPDIVKDAFLRERQALGARSRESALTQREREVTDLVGEGLANKEIARRLNLTEGTVKVHLHKIYEKLDVTNRTSLVRIVSGRGSAPTRR
jgi:DNA-binding NarL/FixJ family response regulator